MVEIIFRKRVAQPGEMGLFVETEIFSDEWSSLPIGAEVKAECTVPANLKYLKFFWALVMKILENSPDDRFLDKEECGNALKVEARHFKKIYDPLRGKAELKPLSVSNLSADTWIRLLRRCNYAVITQFLPGMEENALKAEIESMLGMDVFAAPAPKSQPKGGERVKPSETMEAAPAAKPRTERKPDVQDREGASQDARSGDHRAEETEECGAESLPVQTVRGLASGDQSESEPEASEDRPTPKPPRTAGPQTEDEYVAACRKWIAAQTDHNKAIEYYDGEAQIAMRASLKIKIGVNKMLRRELAEHCEKQKGTSK